MLVVTCNVNGIRSAERKGFFDFIMDLKPDVVCLQEIKADEAVLADPKFALPGYHAFFSSAEKKGYSGVGIYTQKKPCALSKDCSLAWANAEGRFIEIDLGHCRVASMYFPSGTSGSARQQQKMAFLDHMSQWLKTQHERHMPYLLCGDFNIAHTPMDLKNWKQNQKNSGFLPEERAWLDHCAKDFGMIDAFRDLHPEKIDYTWWTYRGGARSRNVGWRIDYQWLMPDFPLAVKKAWVAHDVVCSDHAPFCVLYG